MGDPQKLIEAILADTKFAENGNFASRVYRDEPILLTATQMERYTPSKYRAMRKIARDGGLYQEPEAKIFYEQGKFMEDFEDDYEFQGKFARYFPTYQSMSDPQLRGYFSWRTEVRRGLIKKTSLSFAFVYIYELLNQIGVNSPADGFSALKDFWEVYKEIDPHIDSYVKTWLKDYIVYYDLDRSLLESFSEADFDRSVLTLLGYESRNPEEVFVALNSLSSYNLANSRFFKRYPDDVKKVTYDVFSAFSDYCGKKRKKTLCEKLLGKVYSGSYFMFKSAVFYNQTPHRDFVYEISDIHKYICQGGNWSCERFFRYGDKNRQIGALLKTIDFFMRQKYNFPSTLKAGQSTKILEGLITKAIDEYRGGQRDAARSEIKIDISKLQNIRDASRKTQSKLIIEELDETGPRASSAEKAEPENDAGLGQAERLLLSCLLYGRPYDDLIRSRGLMLSVLMDSINEKLFDLFGDTVMTDAEGRPELIEDYTDQLKELIKE